MTTSLVARRYITSGLSIIPIRDGGSKAPAVDEWAPYQSRKATNAEVEEWFNHGDGIAVIAGKISGNLEAIDHDTPELFTPWCDLVQADAPGLLQSLPIVQTPRDGRHVLYRCETIEGNLKLARAKKSDGKVITLIETRGEGGYFIVPPTPGRYHPSGRPYRMLRGDMTKIPTITPEERAILFDAARSFNRYVERIREIPKSLGANAGTRPGDLFAAATSWPEILASHGWRMLRQRGNVTYWQRPGKQGPGSSATTGFDGRDILYVFSSNAYPFESEVGYSKFTAYTMLNHNGDFAAATKAVAAIGFGVERIPAGQRRWVAGPFAPSSGEAASEDPYKAECPYRATDGGIIWDKPINGGSVATPLTNFKARIIAEIAEDDGTETRRSFEIEAHLNGTAVCFQVPAIQFPGMSWPTEHLGANAIVFPGFGAKDHARAAIQLLSGRVPGRQVFTHTGWRKVRESWVYLHSGGGIGQIGQISDVDVILPDALRSFHLPEPPEGDDLKVAVRASLRVLSLAPHRLTAPLLAMVYRAPLGACDFSGHLAGPSGVGKTEIGAICQQHFGSSLDSRNLPGSWSSTGNALESLAFAAKDTLLTVDDFAPTGSMADVQRYHREADRILRAQGNRSGRMRLRADATLRTAKPPRGEILSTGEDIPKGQSLKARILILEVGPNDLDWNKLTECQSEASQGLYAQAMAGYVQWLAGQYETVRNSLRAKILELRQMTLQSSAHRRTPEITANLAMGWQHFLAFAEGVGAVTAEEADRFWQQAWTGLGEAATRQASHQIASEPTRRFLELLNAAVASGRAHIAAADGTEPEKPKAWGWRLTTVGAGQFEHEEWKPQGARIGWLDDDELYLEPDAAYAVVQVLARDGGDAIPLAQKTLHKRLHERGLLASTEQAHGTLTVRQTLGGARRSVLHLKQSSLIPPESSQSAQSTQQSRSDRPDERGEGENWVDSRVDSMPPQRKSTHENYPKAAISCGERAQNGDIGQIGRIGQISEITNDKPDDDDGEYF